ncbi:Mpo1-like protein [Pyxidicoccus sp. 3LG]
MSDRLQTYAEFWPFYLREHSLPSTRWIHFVGTSLGTGIGITAAVTGRGLLVPAALVAAYGFAWFSHFVIERNKPASFKYPLWSLISDYRMAALMATGQLGPHMERALAGGESSGAANRMAAAQQAR